MSRDDVLTSSYALRMQAPHARHQVSSHARCALGGAWDFVGVAPESIAVPAELDALVSKGDLQLARMPSACSIGAALRELGQLSLDAPPDLDGRDWWMKCAFGRTAGLAESRSDARRDAVGADVLVFEGLATIVDVWLNGEHLGRANNMFVAWEADVSALLRDENELVLCARALSTRLAPRRPRARWRAHLLDSQEWRWHRTTQMGRIPGFGPQVPLVGPWREIVLERRERIGVETLVVSPRHSGIAGALDVDVTIRSAEPPARARLTCGALKATLELEQRGSDEWRVWGTLESSAITSWSVHTHGHPTLHDCAITIEVAGDSIVVDVGPIGFRNVSLDSDAGQFALTLNGARPFLRGSCWTPRDWLRPELTRDELELEMTLLRDAGVNCVRLSGCFLYGSDALLAACDRYGIAVWHDLMFSVLDYPGEDDAFALTCAREVEQAAARMQTSACVLVVCGSSEVDQQAAMMGTPLSETRHPLFHDHLARVVRRVLPRVPYWPSTPSGGVVPFRTDVGTAHYFGVGAYRRPLDDARRAEVRFTTECLAFSHLPEPESPAELVLNDADPDARARWAARVPRDSGANWDFEDVRDHYVSRFFGVDVTRCRREEPSRYLALGRAATAIAVERTLQEWRRSASPCQGAMTWLWADPWEGASWGYVDVTGRPKSSWYAMRRASRPVAMALTNEGVNGVDLHVWNDGPRTIRGTLHLRLLRGGATVVHAVSVPLVIEGGASQTLSCEEVLGRFVDIAYAYRFGPPAHDVVHAIWTDDAVATHATGAERSSNFGDAPIIDEAVLLPHGDVRPTIDTGLQARIVDVEANGAVTILLTTTAIAQMVRIGSAAYRPDDSYFTLLPGVERRVRLTLVDSRAEDSIVVEALNDRVSQRIELSGAGAHAALRADSSAPLVEREVNR